MNFNEIQPLPLKCTQSCLNCAAECERKLFCRYIMGVRLRGVQYKEGATLGKIYHKLQLHGPGKEQEVRAWVRGQQTALMARVDKGEDLDGELSRLATMLTSLYTKAEVMAHIFWEKFPVPSYLETIAQEITHTVEWNGLILEGTIDKLQLNRNIGDVWTRDHKTSGLPLAVIFGGLGWSSQARIYRILATDWLQTQGLNWQKRVSPGSEKIEHQVKGFILDGIIKPSIKSGTKADIKNAKDWGCSLEDAYLRRVKEWYRDYEVKAELKGQIGAKAIDSKGIYYTEPMFPDELKTALYKMKEISKRLIHPAYFSRDITRQACFMYEKQCLYHPLCETDPAQWDQLFETKYKLVNEVEAKNDKENL